MRTFELTHPWLKFQVQLTNLSPSSWLHLGEAAANGEHLARAPLLPGTAKDLLQTALVKGAWAITAVGNNTLSEEQVLRAVAGGLQVPRAQEHFKQEVVNVIGLLREISTQAAERKLPPLTPALICGYQARLLQGLELPENVGAGEFRHHSVVVPGAVYRGAPASDCPYLVERLCEWLEGSDFTPEPGRQQLAWAILKAVVAHVYLAWIQPFGDANGRTARMIEFHLLLAAGMPPAAAHLLSQHYNQTRAEYYFQLDLAGRSGGDLLPFLRYAVRGLADGLKAQFDFIWARQWDLTWCAHVHELFRDKGAAGDTRQRHLALDLRRQPGWVSIGDIPELTPRLARAYAQKTPKTLQRDLNLLAEFHLIDREPRRVRARHQLVPGLQPVPSLG